RELAEKARRHDGDVVARLELPLEFDFPLLGPRRQVERQRDDRNEERRRKPDDRRQAGGQRLARRHPDDHLAIAIPARKREQHGQEERDRQQNVQIKQRVEAKQRQDAVGRDRSARGARQQPQHQIGKQDREQDEEQPDRGRRQLADQATPENHDGGKILTFLRRFDDNARVFL